MNTELIWTTLPRGTQTAILNPIRLDVWGDGKWTAFNMQTNCYIGSGKSDSEIQAKEDATNFARNWIHPIEEAPEWKDVHLEIDSDASKHGLTDCDVAVAWKLGLKTFLEVKSWGGKFPHE